MPVMMEREVELLERGADYSQGEATEGDIGWTSITT